MNPGSFRLIRILASVFSLAACAEQPAEAMRGKLLIERYHCGTCHQIPGVNAADGHFAVTLEHFGSRSYIGGHVPNTHGNLVRWVIDPAAVIPGTLMPDMGVTAHDADAIAAYLMTLR